ncbi:hypothetical protein IF128_11245 [Empedobacter stercoris]|uniref:DUF4230 domain-containing protein n=1 Tax=Empedobacter stercoris TaxID=1628248 RepID=A0ABX1WNW0_9FLAO|nr:hypothetical protein [Empedobacter stercoris]MCA4810307.1 hypothetical protein [Empedobacter stercoris]NOJ76383.1 hypothetical protein [Empedobacter stercoris]QNT14515.1 hypothetical protein HNV03_07480 [Empedobacter stercoris]
MKNNSRIIFILFFLIIFISFIMIYCANINFHKHYKIDYETFSVEIKSETYYYNSKNNIYKRYYLNDTIVIKNALNSNEYSSIIELANKSKVFNFDSIYIIPNHEKIITLPFTETELKLQDRNRNRYFKINSDFYENKLSNRKDFVFTTELIQDIKRIIDANKNIKSLPITDLEFY